MCNKDYNKEDYGVMFYHRNRLIKPYEKLGYQKQVCLEIKVVMVIYDQICVQCDEHLLYITSDHIHVNSNTNIY